MLHCVIKHLNFPHDEEAGGFYLREYTASIMQEDGTEREEVVNENANILLLMNANQPKGMAPTLSL